MRHSFRCPGPVALWLATALLTACRYLEDHAWGNAEPADFVAALSRSSGRDLGPWAEEWLGAADAPDRPRR